MSNLPTRPRLVEIIGEYQVFNPMGALVMHATEELRYPKLIERSMLEAGYTIRLHGKPVTINSLRKGGKP